MNIQLVCRRLVERWRFGGQGVVQWSRWSGLEWVQQYEGGWVEAETPDVLRGIHLILGFSQNHFTANSSMDNMPDHHHAPYLRIF
jgi:hypothetical protein